VLGGPVRLDGCVLDGRGLGGVEGLMLNIDSGKGLVGGSKKSVCILDARVTARQVIHKRHMLSSDIGKGLVGGGKLGGGFLDGHVKLCQVS
jgi:hypothetical protein